MRREGALDPELPGRIFRLFAEPTPEDAAANRAQRRLSVAAARERHAACRTAEEIRAARGAALELCLQAKRLALDTPTRESLTTFAGRGHRAPRRPAQLGGERAIRTVTLRPRTRDVATAR